MKSYRINFHIFTGWHHRDKLCQKSKMYFPTSRKEALLENKAYFNHVIKDDDSVYDQIGKNVGKRNMHNIHKPDLYHRTPFTNDFLFDSAALHSALPL